MQLRQMIKYMTIGAAISSTVPFSLALAQGHTPPGGETLPSPPPGGGPKCPVFEPNCNGSGIPPAEECNLVELPNGNPNPFTAGLPAEGVGSTDKEHVEYFLHTCWISFGVKEPCLPAAYNPPPFVGPNGSINGVKWGFYMGGCGQFTSP